jgi:hypothetical protein
MASFNFTSVVPDEGTTFTFGSWVYITNDSGGLNNHLANPKKLEVSASTSSRDIANYGKTNLNYTGSSTQVLSQGLQHTSNGVTP